MFKMPFNKAKIYDICMMEISMLFVKYGIIRDYEIKFIIFEVIVRYFNFYTEQDDISGKGCIIRNITFNSSVSYFLKAACALGTFPMDLLQMLTCNVRYKEDENAIDDICTTLGLEANYDVSMKDIVEKYINLANGQG